MLRLSAKRGKPATPLWRGWIGLWTAGGQCSRSRPHRCPAAADRCPPSRSAAAAEAGERRQAVHIISHTCSKLKPRHFTGGAYPRRGAGIDPRPWVRPVPVAHVGARVASPRVVGRAWLPRQGRMESDSAAGRARRIARARGGWRARRGWQGAPHRQGTRRLEGAPRLAGRAAAPGHGSCQESRPLLVAGSFCGASAMSRVSRAGNGAPTVGSRPNRPRYGGYQHPYS